jgi:hypothetical protein
MTTKIIARKTIRVPFIVDTDELWETITGSDFALCDVFATEIEVGTLTDSDEPCLRVKYYDIENLDSKGQYKIKRKTLSLWRLANAYVKALQANQTHCGGYNLSLDNSDACFAVFVIQTAIYGEVQFS